MDLSLDEIKEMLEMPNFDVLRMLETHRTGLEARIDRLRGLISSIDSTILHLTGEMKMSRKQLFSGFSEEDERRYAQEAREEWDAEEVDGSYKRWGNYSQHQKDSIKAEGQAVYEDLASAIEQGSASPQVQTIIARWHQHLRHFYEPSIDRLLGLGQLYVDHPDFASKFREIHSKLPEFMRDAVQVYCANINQDN